MTNYNEMIMATLRGEPTEFLPFIPRLDLWYKANKVRGTLPDEYQNATLYEIVDDLDVGCHSVIPDFMDFIDPLDQIDRALGIYRLRTFPYRIELRVKRNVSFDGDFTTVQYLTPYGNIKTKVKYDEEMRRSGITITQIVEYAIKSVNDYKALAYIFQNAEIIPTYDNYLCGKEEIGNRGVIPGCAHLAASPIQMLMRDLMPMEQFFYQMLDSWKEMKWLCEQLDMYLQKIIQVTIDSPSEIILLGGNYDCSITYPPFFKEHITPALAAAADLVHSKGKFLATHADGDNKGLLKELVASKIDIADSICPAPMTSVTMEEYQKVFGKKITIWGGIPSIIVLEDSFSEYEFDSYMNKFLENIGPGDHLLLHVADTIPPDAKFSRIKKIAKLAREFGPVQP